MTTFLLTLHIIVSLSLVFIVLVQGGKGADIGAAFGGGSSNTVFGGRGATSFLSKMTTVVAIVFMLTSLLLAMDSVKTKSVIKDTPSVPAAAAPAEGPGGMSTVPPSETESSAPPISEPAGQSGQ